MPERMTPKMMTRELAAEYTGLSTRQLKRREEAGSLPRLKPSGLNGGTYYRTSDLDALIDAAAEAGKKVGKRPSKKRG